MKEKDYIITKTDNNDNTEPFEWTRSAKNVTESPFGKLHKLSLTEDDYSEIIEKYDIYSTCQKVVNAFKRLTKVNLDNIDFVTNLSRRSLRAFAQIKGGKSIIDIDNYLTEEIHSYFILIFLWADLLYQESVSETGIYEDNITFAQMNDIYFKYLFTKYYALIKDNNRCDIYTLKYVLKESEKIGTSSIFNLAVCCEQCAKYFLIAHECAHIYFQRGNLAFFAKDEATVDTNEEFLADKVAFDIINNMISTEEKGNVDGERVLYPYTYKAPIMLLGFYYLYFVVLSLFDKSSKPFEMIDVVKERIGNLKNHIHHCESDYDRTDGDNVYEAINDTIDTFLQIFYTYKENGRLNEIINLIEKR